MFAKDTRGSIAVIVALAMPVLLVGIGGAIETSRAVTFRQRLWSAVELSCTQSALYANAQKQLDVATNPNATSFTYPTMTADITNRNFVAKTISATPTPTVATTDTTVQITATRSQPLVFSNLLTKPGGFTFTATKTCAINSTPYTKGSLPAQVIFSESFETNQSVATSWYGWEVDGGYNNNNTWNGWTTQGAGVEIDSQRAIAVSSVLFGSYFAELDSDCNTAVNYGNAGCNSNSTISRIMNLTPGTYQIRYWYVSRLYDGAVGNSVICGGTDSAVSYYTTNGQTNRIELYVERAGNYTYNINNIKDVCVQSNNWTERVVNFTVATTSDYRISWRAAGRQDTYGGLIDYLRICRNSCPAS